MRTFDRFVLWFATLGAVACSQEQRPVEPTPPTVPTAPATPSSAAPSAPATAEPAQPAPAAAEAAADVAAPPTLVHDARLVRRIVEAYDALRQQLATGDFEAAKLGAIDVGVRAAGGRGTIYLEMADAARKVTEQRTLAESRAAFSTLSQRLRGVVADTPVVAGQVHAFRCAQGAGSGIWLQLDDVPRNPYQGGEGPVCAQPIAVHP